MCWIRGWWTCGEDWLEDGSEKGLINEEFEDKLKNGVVFLLDLLVDVSVNRPVERLEE
jgi:hypothetical protein